MTDQARAYRATASANIGPGFKPGFYPDSFWDDQNFDVLSISVPGNNDAPVAYVIPGTDLALPSFPAGAKITEVPASKELEHAWEIGTSIYPHAHIVKLAAGAGDVRLGFDYRIAYGTTVVTGTKPLTLTVTDADVLDELLFADFGEIALTEFTEVGPQVTFRFFRDPTHADDDYDGAIAVTTVGWHFKRDSAGSRQVTTK